MGKSKINRIPFTEIFERAQLELVRDSATAAANEAKYKGVVNDVYLVDFPILLPEDLIRKTGNITTIADYSTGLITIDNGDSAIVGDSDCAWTSAITNDSLLKADGEETIYRVTYGDDATDLDLSAPSTWKDDDVDDGAYKLMFDRYALAGDFGYMVQDDKDKPEAVSWWTGSGKAWLEPEDNGEYNRDFIFNASTPAFYTVKRDATTGDSPYLYIRPCDDSTRVLFYDYIPQLIALTEYTTDSIKTLANASTAVVSNAGTVWGDTDFIDIETYDYYFRIDVDGTGSNSVWYKIASITDDDNLVLSTGYDGTAISSGSVKYTISRVSKWPTRFDRALVYGAALRIDPNNRDAERWKELYGALVGGFKAVDGKRIHGQKGSYNRK